MHSSMRFCLSSVGSSWRQILHFKPQNPQNARRCATELKRAFCPAACDVIDPCGGLAPGVADYQRFLLPPKSRCWPPPPPPCGRSLRSGGRASLTTSARPIKARPLQAWIAWVARASSLISTNPNPLALPLNRSRRIFTVSTRTPASSKNAWMSVSVALYGKFPTNSFVIDSLLTVVRKDRSSELGELPESHSKWENRTPN